MRGARARGAADLRRLPARARARGRGNVARASRGGPGPYGVERCRLAFARSPAPGARPLRPDVQPRTPRLGPGRVHRQCGCGRGCRARADCARTPAHRDARGSVQRVRPVAGTAAWLRACDEAGRDRAGSRDGGGFRCRRSRRRARAFVRRRRAAHGHLLLDGPHCAGRDARVARARPSRASRCRGRGIRRIALGECIAPTLATVVQPAVAIGHTACRELIRTTADGRPPGRTYLPFTVRDGESWGRKMVERAA